MRCPTASCSSTLLLRTVSGCGWCRIPGPNRILFFSKLIEFFQYIYPFFLFRTGWWNCWKFTEEKMIFKKSKYVAFFGQGRYIHSFLRISLPSSCFASATFDTSFPMMNWYCWYTWNNLNGYHIGWLKHWIWHHLRSLRQHPFFRNMFERVFQLVWCSTWKIVCHSLIIYPNLVYVR